MSKEHSPAPPGFAPPPPPYSTQATGPGGTVVIVQSASFGPEAQKMICPHCQADITTRLETEATTKTHIIALIFCLLTLWPCACCTYCIPSCLARKHYCPECNAFLGAYNN